MEIPKDYVFDMIVDYDDYTEFHYKNILGDVKVFVVYKDVEIVEG